VHLNSKFWVLHHLFFFFIPAEDSFRDILLLELHVHFILFVKSHVIVMYFDFGLSGDVIV